MRDEGSGGTEGTTLRDTGLPCIVVTHMGVKTGAIRKIPLMRVAVDKSYVLIGSYGGRPKNPVWVYNLRTNPDVEIRDKAEVCQRRSKSTPLAGVKMHHLMRFSPPGQPWAGLSGFWGFPSFLALVETAAVAVHLQDMNVVCEPVQQRPSQALGTEHLGPLIER